jgi:hypothetical protein
MENLSDPPRNTQFDMVPFPNLSGFNAVEAGNVTCACETGLGEVMLLA